MGTGWAAGYVLGYTFTAKLVANVGHVRTFGVMCAFAGIAILASLLVVSPLAWIPMRAISGFCFAGAAMIVESWLTEKAAPSSRGKIFGVYTMVNLFGTTLGQMVVPLGDTTGHLFFVLGAMVYCLALVPTALSSGSSPKPLVSIRLDVGALWRNSPVAVVACLLVGLSNSAFGTLTAIYASDVGLSLASVALFASFPIFAGGLVQIPVGALSDRMDRRYVLLGVAFVALAMDATFLMFSPTDQLLLLGAAAVFGMSIYTLYPIIVSHASDHAAQGTFIQVSGGLLLIYGCGSMVGPLVAGVAMAQFGPNGLFMTTCGAHMSIIAFTILRMCLRTSVSEESKASFESTPPAPILTPETAVLARGGSESASSRDVDATS